jgi:hypothetical protein
MYCRNYVYQLLTFTLIGPGEVKVDFADFDPN